MSPGSRWPRFFWVFDCVFSYLLKDMCWALKSCVDVLEDWEGISFNQIHQDLSAPHYIIKLSKINRKMSVIKTYTTIWHKNESHAPCISIIYKFLSFKLMTCRNYKPLQYRRTHVSPSCDWSICQISTLMFHNKLFIKLINILQIWFIIY